jgi:hypothetical protein
MTGDSLLCTRFRYFIRHQNVFIVHDPLGLSLRHALLFNIRLCQNRWSRHVSITIMPSCTFILFKKGNFYFVGWNEENHENSKSEYCTKVLFVLAQSFQHTRLMWAEISSSWLTQQNKPLISQRGNPGSILVPSICDYLCTK